jgi:AraC-like DNA-binding protein
MTGMSSLHLSAGDIIRKIKASDKVRGYHIVFSDEFHAEIRTTRNSPINLQLKKEYPYQIFTEKEYDFLLQSVSRLITYINDTTHFYHALVIKNEVHNLVLNISDKRRKEHGDKIYKADRQKMILERFKNLLNGHCEKQHEVSWYAEALTISADYLSKITKENDGRSARAWINEAIIAKAASLMHYADLNIKEISEKLNFTDQSSFGRFIRKNTGMSPKEFRGHVTETGS